MKKKYIVLPVIAVVFAVAAPFLNKKLDDYRVVLPDLQRPAEP